MIFATLCYLQRDGRTLMLHRNRPADMHYGKWNGLGGKMHPGETPEECVAREVREESGFEIRNPRLHGILTFPEFNGGRSWYAFVFTAREFDGAMLKEPPEGALEWIPDERVLELPLWEGDRYFIRWIQEGRFFSGRFTYVEGILRDHAVVFYK